MVTPSISTVNRLCWLKSPAVFLVLPLRTSRLNFTGIQLLLSLPRAGAVHCDPAAVDPLPGFHFTLSGPAPDPPPLYRPPRLGDTNDGVPDLVRTPIDGVSLELGFLPPRGGTPSHGVPL